MNGSIFLLRPRDEGNQIRFDVWEMVKLGDGVVSLSKLFTISPLVRQLLMNNKDEQLILYDIKTQHSKHFLLLLDEEDNNPSYVRVVGGGLSNGGSVRRTSGWSDDGDSVAAAPTVFALILTAV